jgi:hypothetical protein
MSSGSIWRAFQPGDILLYSHRGPIGWIIGAKTWSRFTHVEIAGAAGTAYASRIPDGVRHFPFDPKDLALVLRPFKAFNARAARHWFTTVDGQGYDYIGLLNFTTAQYIGPTNRRQFCSEFAARFLRAGGMDLFNRQDADTISPRDFTLARTRLIWESDREIQHRFESHVGGRPNPITGVGIERT